MPLEAACLELRRAEGGEGEGGGGQAPIALSWLKETLLMPPGADISSSDSWCMRIKSLVN